MLTHIAHGRKILQQRRQNALELSIYSPAHRVFDTANNGSLNALVSSEMYKPQFKLSALASSLLGETIQQTEAHIVTL